MPTPATSWTRTIAVINQKGGVGKTTTTVNLAAALAARGRRTLLVDLDPQGHATLHLGHDPAGIERGAYDVLTGEAARPDTCLIESRPNLWLLPGETGLASLESTLAGDPDRLARLARALQAIAGEHAIEFVLIDCPPSLGLLTLAGLAAAREVFIPMQAHFLALQGVGKLLETVSVVAREVNPRLRVTGVLVCMHDASSTHAREVVSDLDAFFTDARDQDVPWRSARVYRPAVRRNIKLAESPSFGKSIFEYAPGCPGAQDYAQLAEAMISEWDLLRARRAAGDATPAVVVPAPGTPVAP